MQFPSSQVNWPSRQPVNLRKVVYGSPRKKRKNYHQKASWDIFVSHSHSVLLLTLLTQHLEQKGYYGYTYIPFGASEK